MIVTCCGKLYGGICKRLPMPILRTLVFLVAIFSLASIIGLVLVMTPHTSIGELLPEEFNRNFKPIAERLLPYLPQSSFMQNCSKTTFFVHQNCTFPNMFKSSISFWVEKLTMEEDSGHFWTLDWAPIISYFGAILILLSVTALLLACGAVSNNQCLICPWLVITFLIQVGMIATMSGLVYVTTKSPHNVPNESKWIAFLVGACLVSIAVVGLQLSCVCAYAKRLDNRYMDYRPRPDSRAERLPGPPAFTPPPPPPPPLPTIPTAPLHSNSIVWNTHKPIWLTTL